MPHRAYASTLALLAALVAGAWAMPDNGPRDVLDTPALKSTLAASSLVNGLTLAGQRVVAVGQRGHVLLSDDHGKSWQQASVPVSADLVAVSFPSAEQGWAVGHDGVVLASSDAGRSWVRQLDGRTLGDVLVKHYKASGDAKWLAEAQRFASQGAENPLLDVWFDDANNGFVVGAFGLVLRTADGGKSWQPLMHATDNPKSLHLYAVRRVGGELYIAGEQGLLLKLDRASGRFTRSDHPYQGTLVRRGRQRARGARVRPARQRGAQHRRRAHLAIGAHRRVGRAHCGHARRARPHRAREPGRARADQRRRRCEFHAAEDGARAAGGRRDARRPGTLVLGGPRGVYTVAGV